MPKEFKPQILSANDLLSGDVIYLNAAGDWTESLGEAAIAHSQADAEQLQKQADQPARVVGPYLLDVTIREDGLPTPAHFRERFRERGPSNRPDLGRQAEGLTLELAGA